MKYQFCLMSKRVFLGNRINEVESFLSHHTGAAVTTGPHRCLCCLYIFRSSVPLRSVADQDSGNMPGKSIFHNISASWKSYFWMAGEVDCCEGSDHSCETRPGHTEADCAPDHHHHEGGSVSVQESGSGHSDDAGQGQCCTENKSCHPGTDE